MRLCHVCHFISTYMIFNRFVWIQWDLMYAVLDESTYYIALQKAHDLRSLARAFARQRVCVFIWRIHTDSNRLHWLFEIIIESVKQSTRITSTNRNGQLHNVCSLFNTHLYYTLSVTNDLVWGNGDFIQMIYAIMI